MGNAGELVPETSQADKTHAIYSWPNNKVWLLPSAIKIYIFSIPSSPALVNDPISDFQRPRVCILGGGFGGLYTALRLQSLVWPDDKKPQVS